MNGVSLCLGIAFKRAVALFSRAGFVALLAFLGLSPANATTTTYYLDITLAGGNVINGTVGYDPTSGAPVSDDLLLTFTPPSATTLSFNTNPTFDAYPSTPSVGETTYRTFTDIVDGYNLEVQTAYTIATETQALEGVILCGPGTTSVEICPVADVGREGYFSTIPEVASTPLPAGLPLFATGLVGLGLFGWRRRRKAQVVAA